MKIICGGVAAVSLLLLGVAPVGATTETSEPDSGYVLEGGQEGTTLRSLTIEGEDRIQFDFERPTLRIDIDASQVPGLELGSAMDVLDRSRPELLPTLLASTATSSSPYLGRPWLSNYASGAVARFQPRMEGVERWTLTVADSRGQTVATFSGKGNPSDEIAWDGKTVTGEPVLPGLTYSYVLEAFDKAGNKRNFVGESFQIPAYRFGDATNVTLVLTGSDLSGGAGDLGGSGWAPGMAGTPPHLIEAASWMNQSAHPSTPVRIKVTARSYDQATRLANQVSDSMRELVIADPALVQAVTDVRPDAPAAATVQISRATPAPSRTKSPGKR